MKNLLLLFILLFTSFSCSKENDSNVEFKSTQYPQNWRLVQMTGSITGVPPSTGKDMSWQESYTLQRDKTFIKSREIDNVTTKASGTYDFISLSDGTYLELTYRSNNTIIGNCSSDIKELLKLSADNKLTGTWWACDGPGLLYERVE